MALKTPSKHHAHDLRWGMYRRIYACWVTGKRINTVSEGAALLFAHLHCAADDFGNLRGERFMVKAHAASVRESFTPTRIEKLLKELAETAPPLIRFYEVSGEHFIHIMNFTERQPAGKNGRRVMRFPREPSEFGESEHLGFTNLMTDRQSGAPHEHEHEQIPLTPLRRGDGLRPRERKKRQAAAAQESARDVSHAEHKSKLARLAANAVKPGASDGGVRGDAG